MECHLATALSRCYGSGMGQRDLQVSLSADGGAGRSAGGLSLALVLTPSRTRPPSAIPWHFRPAASAEPRTVSCLLGPRAWRNLRCRRRASRRGFPRAPGLCHAHTRGAPGLAGKGLGLDMGVGVRARLSGVGRCVHTAAPRLQFAAGGQAVHGFA